MVELSPAARLQNAVLRMAARDRSKLNLIQATEQYNPFRQNVEGVIQPGEHVLILGAATSGTVRLAVQRAGRAGSILILEPDPTHFQDALEQTSDIKHQLGYENWHFVQTELDDLRTDPTVLARLLTECPVADVSGYLAMQAQLDEQRTATPLVPDHTIDVAILDMAMNRLPRVKADIMLAETRRVLRSGGRLVVSVLLADEPTTDTLPVLTHGPALCYVPVEANVIPVLAAVGYHGMRYLWRDDLPASVLNGIEFRTFIIEAYNGKPSNHRDAGQAVIYRGPWKQVIDDEGICYSRGDRTAVSTRTYETLQQAPYREEVFGIPCYVEIPTEHMPPFDVRTPQLRDPQITKGTQSLFDTGENTRCDVGSGCCPSDDVAKAANCGGDPAKFSQIRSGAVVLELGSGSGNDTATIARLSGETGRVICVEPSESMRVRARAHVARLGLDRVSFTDGAAHNLPLPDASVDIIIGNSSLFATADPKKAWTEVTRVLRPGGRFTVTDKVMGNQETRDMGSNNQDKGAVSRHWHDYHRNLREVGVSGLRIINVLPLEQPDGDTIYSITLCGRSGLAIPIVSMQVFHPHEYLNHVSRAMMAFMSSLHVANVECDFELLNIADHNAWNMVEFALRADGASEETLARDRVYVMANGQLMVHWKPTRPDADTGDLTALLQKSLSARLCPFLEKADQRCSQRAWPRKP